MAIFKKPKYIEFQLATNRCWYIAELLSGDKYRLLFCKSEVSNSYDAWNWPSMPQFHEAATLSILNDAYTLLNCSHFTEDELFIKIL